MKTTPLYDVIIIGGSYAGLSAAMALGRTLRKVLIIDSGQPCNRQTPHSHNFLTQDGATPAQIAQTAKDQVLAYETVEFHEDLVIQASEHKSGFEIKTQSDQLFYSKKLLLAFGIKDQFPEIPGFAECWGISVIHCPYCHGYEFRGKKTGILAKGERAYHLATLVSKLTDQLQIFSSRPSGLSPEQLEKLGQNGIEVLEKPISEIHHSNGYLEKVTFADGSTEPFDAVYADVPFSLPENLTQSLGCKIHENGRIEVDQFQQTSVTGVYACGDCANPLRSVASSVYSGNLAGAMINHALSTGEF
jgi:thioredoxin reductase